MAPSARLIVPSRESLRGQVEAPAVPGRSEGRALRLFRRGASKRKIHSVLAQKGVSAQDIEAECVADLEEEAGSDRSSG